ncbi:MAG: hypothetical protein RIS86_739, partial [Planctomycetota bacterium]
RGAIARSGRAGRTSRRPSTTFSRSSTARGRFRSAPPNWPRGEAPEMVGPGGDARSRRRARIRRAPRRVARLVPSEPTRRISSGFSRRGPRAWMHWRTGSLGPCRGSRARSSRRNSPGACVAPRTVGTRAGDGTDRCEARTSMGCSPCRDCGGWRGAGVCGFTKIMRRSQSGRNEGRGRSFPATRTARVASASWGEADARIRAVSSRARKERSGWGGTGERTGSRAHGREA